MYTFRKGKESAHLVPSHQLCYLSSRCFGEWTFFVNEGLYKQEVSAALTGLIETRKVYDLAVLISALRDLPRGSH